ncbi:hypothetical protein B0H10DRAFT_1946026 [Mycena sp. CBHHK59/15]|nr:hypothetical protein B0H10DRAFT_1946026 [Mycena sp. CBHHK59/15]
MAETIQTTPSAALDDHAHVSASAQGLASDTDISGVGNTGQHVLLSGLLIPMASAGNKHENPEDLAAFNLLPEILWAGHSVPVQQQTLRRLNIPGLTSTTVLTCIKLSQFRAAVETLEQGLAVIFQQMLQLKADSYDGLSNASQGGPVMILTSHEDQCDGIILLTPASDPVHVPLPTVTLELPKSQKELLKDLFDHFNVRNGNQASSSRHFGNTEDLTNSTQKGFEEIFDWFWTHVNWSVDALVFDWSKLMCYFLAWNLKQQTVVAARSLLYAYAKSSSNTPPKLAFIGVTHTDSNSSDSLKGVGQEVKKIASTVKEPYHVQHLVGERATMDAVKLQLQECSWVHLACSGGQNPIDPTKSHLRLYDGNLDLETILRMHLPNAQFVFLSAPETAMGDAELVNESFHLAGGFIAAVSKV